MSPATEEPNTTTSSTMMMIDEIDEFSAPCFFDFIKDETDDHKIKAELWFDSLPSMKHLCKQFAASMAGMTLGFRYIQRLVDQFPPVKAFHFILDHIDECGLEKLGGAEQGEFHPTHVANDQLCCA
ncbi:hypothetical protein ABKV19_027560 [Rosa sericea]